jgi:hypothetical protein
VIARGSSGDVLATDDSDGFLTIKSAPSTPGLRAQLLSPNGGETVRVGMPFEIRWASSGAASHRGRIPRSGDTCECPG